jgi:hypothetical protein
VALVAEDERLLRFTLAAARRVACDRAELRATPVLGGCRAKSLRHEIERQVALGTDLVIVAADAHGARHRRSASWKQERQELLAGLQEHAEHLLAAVADPCVEGWMLAHPAALEAGLEAATGRECRSVAAVPTFSSERDARRALGSHVRALTGHSLTLAGVEYAEEILAELNPLDSPAESLRAWARELDRRLREQSGAD